MTISAGSLASAADVNAALATKVNDTGDTMTGALVIAAGTGAVVTASGSGVFGNANTNHVTVSAGNGNTVSSSGVLALQGGGANGVSVLASGGGTVLSVNGSASAVVNGIQATAATTGNAPAIAPLGTDTNIQLALSGKGGWAAASSGAVKVISPLIQAPGTQVVSAAIVPAISTGHTLSGSVTSTPSPPFSSWSFGIGSDSVGANSANQFINGMFVNYNFGGSTMTGNRQGLQVNMVQGATTGNTPANGLGKFYVAAQTYAAMNFNDNGTGLTFATAHGQAFGGGMAVQLFSGATNFAQATALELNAQIDTGASAAIRNFLSVAAIAGSQQGAIVDAGIWVYSGGGALMQNGILFGGGTKNNWPIDPAGTIIGTDASGGVTAAAAIGIDFSAVAFSQTPLKMPLLTNAANDAAAATASVPVGGFYRNGSIVMQRVS